MAGSWQSHPLPKVHLFTALIERAICICLGEVIIKDLDVAVFQSKPVCFCRNNLHRNLMFSLNIIQCTVLYSIKVMEKTRIEIA
jgi:hypothetical protein